MMEQPTMTPESEAVPEAQGIDGVIAMVDGFLQNPTSATPETLAVLKADLEDLKMVLDGEEPQAAPATEGGLAGMIGG